MRKNYLALSGVLLLVSFFITYQKFSGPEPIFTGEEENEGYDGAMESDLFEFEKTKDPSLGYVPLERLGAAIEYTEDQKSVAASFRSQMQLGWTERGPIYDTIGPSNGNTRAGVNYTSGRIRAILMDTLNDSSGNTVFAGGIAGGLWKCTNFLSTIPNWQPINDYFSNLAISSICQDPVHPSVLYFSTGEAPSNSDAVFGKGVWKSTDAGNSWNFLSSTGLLTKNFKIITDAAGNVYLAARSLSTPIEQPYGLLRSKDGGNSWENITPTGLRSNTICTDIEISSTGKLHAAFGYSTSSTGGAVDYRYTEDPASVSVVSGWNPGTGIRMNTTAVANRLELASFGDLLYAVTTNGSNNVDSCYKSVNGGATWTRQNTVAYPSGVANTQGWYDLTLAINPSNTDQIMVGGLDAYRSINSGASVTRATFWVTTAPYVHADHHFMQWWNADGENRILIANDGGVFLSRNGGTTWSDKNRNLAIKQFYAAAIHPAAGSPYLIAGAQDNGCHQLKYPGLASSIEVTGGDGCFVHINQINPQIQFGSYVYNQYRRSVNGGATWSSQNAPGSGGTPTQGLFVNPFDYDDAQNIMYASNGYSAAPNNQVRRWISANSTAISTSVVYGIAQLKRNNVNSNATAFKVSPYTANRVYVGGSNGRLLRWDNANTGDSTAISANITDLSSPSFPSGFMNCINVGSSDQFLVAVFTNYGVNNVWYSEDGGTSWTAVDGDLPDMPVRWAIFHPQYNNRLIIATEAGVFTTDAVNGANTTWKASNGFPTVRTDMLKLRTSDNTMVAATHGRGLFTTVIPTSNLPEINFATESLAATEQSSSNNGCRGYRDYAIDLNILNPPSGNANLTVDVAGGATASRNIDFDITTNNDFTNPSDQLVFANGMKEKKTVTIRVYDDAQVEPAEQFRLLFRISGATDAVAGLVDEYAVTINDNDHAPQAVPLVQNFTVGNFNSNISTTSPFTSNRIRHRMQSLYTAAELKAAGIYGAGNIKSMMMKVLAKNSTRPFTGFTIAMANTTIGTLSAGFVNTTFTQVYSGNYSSVPGENTFQFTTPFYWDGSSNIAVQFCFDNGAGPADAAADYMEGNSYPLGLGVRASTYANYTTGATAGCSLPAAFVSDFRVNASFGVDFGTNAIATALNTVRSEYLNAANELFYFSSSGQIMARVKNLTTHNYGCAQLTIDRAGTSAGKFWNANKKNFLADKTFYLSPTNANANGRYEVTLYFTREEKEGWEAMTGESWNNILLVKTSGHISEVSPQNSQPNNNGTVQSVLVPVRGTYGNGYTLTAIFENGFGGFGAGMPGRQFNNITINAVTRNQRTSLPSEGVDVVWVTSSEDGTSHFDLEKSYDGVSFHHIATIRASGNSMTPTEYSFTDREQTEMNYYRVRMVYTDQSALMSATALIQNFKVTSQQMFVLGNPFRDKVQVRFTKLPANPVDIRLYDMQGRLISNNRQAPSPVYTVPVLGAAKGVYQLDVLADGKHYKTRVIKQ